MTQSENTSDIIDIDPETAIENDTITPASLPRNARRKLGLFGLSVLALLASAALGGWFYKDLLSSYLPSNQIHALNTRIDALEAANKLTGAKLDAVVGFTDEIKSQLGAAQNAAEDARKLATTNKSENTESNSKLASVERSLADITTRIDDLKNKLVTAPQGSVSVDNSGLLMRLDKLEKDFNNSQQNTSMSKVNVIQLSQALADLKTKVTTGASFSAEIQSLSKMVPAAEGLDVLNSNADKGAATQQQLVENLKSIAAGLAPKSETAPTPDDNSWWGKATSMMSGLVTIKSADAVDWQQIAAQSQSLTEQGQLGDAIKLLEQNLETLPKPLQDWRILAARRIGVDQALEQVGGAVSREIAARG